MDNQYQSNLDNSRFMSAFPAWSGAYKNTFSNTTKMLAPFFQSYSSILGNISEYLANNVKNLDFGFQDKYYYYYISPTSKISTSITTEDGDLIYVGENNINFVGDFPATKIDLVHQTQPIIKESVTFPSIFLQPTYIFIKGSASVQIPINVTIYGINGDGVEISEQIQLISSENYCSLNQYKAVTRYISDTNVLFSTYLDLSTNYSYINSFGPQKRTTLSTGDYFQPIFSFDHQQLSMKNSNSISSEDIGTFYMARTPTKMFISILNDVFYLSGTTLYSSKLYYNYIDKKQYNSTYNNNDFIYVSDDHPNVGDVIQVGINIANISSSYNVSLITISTLDGTHYDLSGNVVPKNTFIDISNSGGKIYMPYTVANTEDITFILSIYNGNQEYSAGYFFNKIPEYQVATNISDMFFKNNNLYVVQLGTTYAINPKRPFFTSSNVNGTPVLVFNKNYSELTFNV